MPHSSRSRGILAVAFGLLLALPSPAAGRALPAPDDAPPGWEWDVDGLERLLPRHQTVAESLRWPGGRASLPVRATKADPPPTGPVRNCAEWEPCTGVLIRYPLGLPYLLLRDLAADVMLHVVVSSTYENAARSNLTANGVDLDRVQFLVEPNDSIWTRDYGPWFVFDGDGQLTVIDHTYNRPWRPDDNLIPLRFAAQQSLPACSHDMVHTGGNYMTDGAHVGSSTRLVYDEALIENGMSEAEVDQLMADYYGLAAYQVLEYIESGGIHHIDTWAKFLDEETVLVKEVWPGHWTYDTLEQRAVLLASLPGSTGRPYAVHRVHCHDIGGNEPASYTNSLILNRSIYVPCFGDAAADSAALAAYRGAAPGYAVRGYYHGGWLGDDALHCRAKGVMDRGMLRVAHVPIRESRVGPVTVTAEVTAHSGAALTGVDLFHRTDGGTWQQAAMAAAGRGSVAAIIPEPAAAGTTEYYLLAADAGGREAGMPRTAPAAWYAFAHAPDLSDAPGAPLRTGARLHQNSPNPFNPATTFRFELHHAGEVRLEILDLRGRRLRTLLDGIRPAGINEATWDGRDGAGRPLPAGVYVYRLRAAGLQYTRRATLVK